MPTEDEYLWLVAQVNWMNVGYGTGGSREPRRPLRALLYWLAGTSTLAMRDFPQSEPDRIAMFGFSVLIPALMGSAGIYFYVQSYATQVTRLTSLLLGIGWAIIILSVNRVLIAGYRPLDSASRRYIQVAVRVLLGVFISSVIAHPFCLDLFKDSILLTFPPSRYP